jgi:hypothetical protein
VVRVGRRGKRSQASAKVRIADEAPEELAQALMRDLGGQKLEEPVELFYVSARFGHERRGVVLRWLEGANLQLQAVAEAFHAPQHAHGVAFAETFVEEVDVAPDARVDAAARIHELEREIGTPTAGAQPLLAGDRERAFDDPVLGKLRNRHGPILGPASAASLARMPLLKPFRALRYAPEVAGPLDALVSPPYDVISPQLQERLLATSPYNSVRLVRPEEPEQAARLLGEWQSGGILVREQEPSAWLLEEDFAGPEGALRTRRGIVARAVLEPYERGIVLPHERSFPKPMRGRLHVLRATRTKLSPILLMHEGPGPDEHPARPPDLEATLDGVTSRLWRVDPAALDRIGPPLFIADGHHRYEAARSFHEEEGTDETAYVLAALVSASDPGLAILPTHRLTEGAPPEFDGTFRLTPANGAEDAVRRLASLPRDTAAFALLRPESVVVAESDEPGLDTALVDRFRLGDVRFTPSAIEAERAVIDGEAGAAFLVRPPTVEQVEAAALAGERMPEKSTYFFPKLASGLLFSPFDE